MRSFFITILLFLTIKIFAYEEPRICIASYVPDQVENLDDNSRRVLKSRLDAITANNDIATIPNGSFVMLPSVNVMNDELIEGGMRNIHKVSIEVSLIIKQLSTEMIFGNYTFEAMGRGYTYQGAIKDAISKIRPNDLKISDWMSVCKNKINEYYVSNCRSMIAKANAMSSRGEYDKALAYLCTYPSNLEGYEDVIDAEIAIYKLYAERQCSALLTYAEAEITKRNFDDAIIILSDIDPTFDCSSEAQMMLSRIDKEIKAIEKAEREAIEREKAAQRRQESEKRYYADKQKERDSQARIARMGVIQNIATSFISSLPSILKVFF